MKERERIECYWKSKRSVSVHIMPPYMYNSGYTGAEKTKRRG